MSSPRSFHIAVMALGGQGGGVLVDWLVDLAEHTGWTAQATSVAGVAQRTGATVYYIELVEPTPGREPVMALMPIPGQVDILIAAEWMEAGRAIERGLVTPDRTTVIASSHRTYAVQEKMTPGNGVANAPAVLQALQAHAKRVIAGDMQALAVAQGSVISASLLGALAASEVLPFPLEAFEAVVQRSGIGVQASLRALHAGACLAQQGEVPLLPQEPMSTAPRPLPSHAQAPALQALLERIRRDFVQVAWPWLGEGLARVVDYQDVAYGQEYLDCVAQIARHDRAAHDISNVGHVLTMEAARWIAVAMSYDDVIRVADLKSRAERFVRLRQEVGAEAGQVYGSQEFFHPRLNEVLGLLPKAWAQWLSRTPACCAWLTRIVDRSRRIDAHTVGGHLQLRCLAGLRRWRRGNHRHAVERAHWQHWLTEVDKLAAQDRALAVELLRCRRLIKGYSDTHERGNTKYALLLNASQKLCGQAHAAHTLANWRALALKELDSGLLAQAIDRHFSIASEATPSFSTQPSQETTP
ncbi:indolepyruvate oxidoreductase subunit beta family protein [Limnohabitans sp.]|uniref:indolepyruvate oxidoreductase subunit beta family protein n=1 Tax=Limnohabitans sp. TaxID=1907725 RepID=UPI00286F0D8E|nr:indolepyruvate oxidoreductase subunit beta family protein [Limnohabitans sp.]